MPQDEEDSKGPKRLIEVIKLIQIRLSLSEACMTMWERKHRIEGYLSPATLPSGLRSGHPAFLIKESSMITVKTG